MVKVVLQMGPKIGLHERVAAERVPWTSQQLHLYDALLQQARLVAA